MVLAMRVLGAVEIALQTRSQLRTGQSVLTAAIRGSSFVYDETVEARLLRPNACIGGARIEIRSNLCGLRGEDFPPASGPGETRVALIGLLVSGLE